MFLSLGERFPSDYYCHAYVGVEEEAEWPEWETENWRSWAFSQDATALLKIHVDIVHIWHLHFTGNNECYSKWKSVILFIVELACILFINHTVFSCLGLPRETFECLSTALSTGPLAYSHRQLSFWRKRCLSFGSHLLLVSYVCLSQELRFWQRKTRIDSENGDGKRRGIGRSEEDRKMPASPRWPPIGTFLENVAWLWRWVWGEMMTAAVVRS